MSQSASTSVLPGAHVVPRARERLNFVRQKRAVIAFGAALVLSLGVWALVVLALMHL